jgi:hypothetical protein
MDPIFKKGFFLGLGANHTHFPMHGCTYIRKGRIIKTNSPTIIEQNKFNIGCV